MSIGSTNPGMLGVIIVLSIVWVTAFYGISAATGSAHAHDIAVDQRLSVDELETVNEYTWTWRNIWTSLSDDIHDDFERDEIRDVLKLGISVMFGFALDWWADAALAGYWFGWQHPGNEGLFAGATAGALLGEIWIIAVIVKRFLGYL